MTLPDPELLRRFVTERSEPAFAELVRRHVDLVHSAALRQVDGDAATAEDVTQAVFTDLARQAARLTRHPSLTGWLYTSTRYLAGNARRSELRRRQREQQAHMMKQLLGSDGPEPDWQQLRPVLDEAMHALGEADRDAVLLRFFERRSLAEVGARLGLSENAARMRVDRALDKLRQQLSRRGLDSTTAAVAIALTGRAVAAAPDGLAARVSQAAFVTPAAGGALILTLFQLMTRTQTKLVLGLAVLAVVLTPVFWRQPDSGRNQAGEAETKAPTTVEGSAATAAGVLFETVAATPATNEALGHLRLTLLAADSSRPVPNVLVERGWVTDAKFQSLRDGTVDVTYPKAGKGLRLTTRADGFADTCLKWSQERGEVVPEAYTVRLERAVPIGGSVVDAQGMPVAGARVGFNHEEDPTASSRTENHDFVWIEVTTDDEGRWQINRIAEDTIRRIYGGASHPEHVESAAVFVSRDPEAEKALRSETHVFRLGGAVTVTGTVVNSSGNPVDGAKVSVGRVGESGRREGITDSEGSFTLPGCPTGKQLLSAQAKGYAATTEEVELAVGSAPFRLVLGEGKLLRLRVVGRDGQPVPKAYVWLNTFGRSVGFPDPAQPAPVQVEVNLRTDDFGRVVWNEAPDTELAFDIEARGHMRVDGYKIRPDGQEHTVTLPPALVIAGTIRDAKSGEAIPKFRIITGWPQVNYQDGTTNSSWSTLERFWLNFGGGEYRHSFEEAVIGGMNNPGYVFKFEAEGYAPFVSRTIGAEEGEVRLDVALRPATVTTITLLTPAGRPAPNTEVALVGAGGYATLTAAGIDRLNGTGSIRVTTDREGRFELPPDDSLVRVIAASTEGFVDATPQRFTDETSTWSLLPWGRIEGSWISGGQPAVGREVLLESWDGQTGALRFDFTGFKQVTDANGSFRFDRVPPGRVKLTRLRRSDQVHGHSSWTHGRSTEVEVPPGETVSVTLGGSGHQVIARLTWPAGEAAGERWQFFGAVHTPMPQPPDEVQNNPEALSKWWQAPERRNLVKTMKQFPLTPQPDGTLSAEDVEAGNYTVSFGAFLVGSPAQNATRAAAAPVPLTVPDEPATGTIDLGLITLQRVPPATTAVRTQP